MIGSRADWLALWKATALARGYPYSEIDGRAGLTDKYFSRLVCGDIDQPTAKTIAAINRALSIELDVRIVGFDSLDGVGGNTKE
jgi:hypothetical protein